MLWVVLLGKPNLHLKAMFFWYSFLQHLAASNVYNRDLDRGQCEFVGDPSVHPLFATTNDDYRFVVHVYR